jgi:hypothetical protein
MSALGEGVLRRVLFVGAAAVLSTGVSQTAHAQSTHFPYIRRDTIYDRLIVKLEGRVDTIPLKFVIRDSLVYAVTPSGLKPLVPQASRTLLQLARTITSTDSLLKSAGVRPPRER